MESHFWGTFGDCDINEGLPVTVDVENKIQSCVIVSVH